MSPIFAPDFTSVDASIHIFDDKGLYRLLCTKVKPVIRESKDKKGNTTINSFVQLNLEMKGRYDSDGKLITEGFAGRVVSPFKCYLHTEGGWKYSKGMIMALAGFNIKKEEQLANEKLFQGRDWTINGEPGDPPESITLGEAWNLLVDRLIDVNLSKKIDKTDDGKELENQDFSNMTPVGEKAISI